jgi:hypothetical protein
MSRRTTSTVIYGRGFLGDAILSWESLPMGPVLANAVYHMMGAAGFTPTPDTSLADLTAVEAAWTGYGAITGPTVVGPVTVAPPGLALWSLLTFIAQTPTPPDPFVQDTCTGWWAEDGTRLIAGGPLEPTPMAIPGDWMALDVLLPVPLSQYGIG